MGRVDERYNSKVSYYSRNYTEVGETVGQIWGSKCGRGRVKECSWMFAGSSQQSELSGERSIKNTTAPQSLTAPYCTLLQLLPRQQNNLISYNTLTSSAVSPHFY